MSTVAFARPAAVPSAADHRAWSVGGVVVIAVACLGVEAVGGLLAARSADAWYAQVARPAWTPPDWVFGPVWSVLYVMMAAAAGRVWLARDREEVSCPLGAFAVQLAANLGWVVLFFGLHTPLLAFLDAVVLWVLVGLTTAHFFTTSRVAGWLLVPYWAWVTYAAALNGSIVLTR